MNHSLRVGLGSLQAVKSLKFCTSYDSLLKSACYGFYNSDSRMGATLPEADVKSHNKWHSLSAAPKVHRKDEYKLIIDHLLSRTNGHDAYKSIIEGAFYNGNRFLYKKAIKSEYIDLWPYGLFGACRSGSTKLISEALDLYKPQTQFDFHYWVLRGICMSRFDNIEILLNYFKGQFKVEHYRKLMEYACEGGSLPAIKYLLQYDQAESTYKYNWNYYKQYACLSGHIEVLEFVLEQLKDKNLSHCDLIYACQSYNVIMVIKVMCLIPEEYYKNMDMYAWYTTIKFTLLESVETDIMKLLLDKYRSIHNNDDLLTYAIDKLSPKYDIDDLLRLKFLETFRQPVSFEKFSVHQIM